GAEILLPADAELALPAGVPQPGDADAVTDRELVAGIRADLGDFPDDLVARDHVRPMCRQVPLGDVQIGAAHTAGVHGDQEFTGTWPRHVDGDAVQRTSGHRTRAANPPRAHGWSGHAANVKSLSCGTIR